MSGNNADGVAEDTVDFEDADTDFDGDIPFGHIRRLGDKGKFGLRV